MMEPKQPSFVKKLNCWSNFFCKFAGYKKIVLLLISLVYLLFQIDRDPCNSKRKGKSHNGLISYQTIVRFSFSFRIAGISKKVVVFLNLLFNFFSK